MAEEKPSDDIPEAVLDYDASNMLHPVLLI